MKLEFWFSNQDIIEDILKFTDNATEREYRVQA